MLMLMLMLSVSGLELPSPFCSIFSLFIFLSVESGLNLARLVSTVTGTSVPAALSTVLEIKFRLVIDFTPIAAPPDHRLPLLRGAHRGALGDGSADQKISKTTIIDILTQYA